jgi:hypothetical protein
MRVRDLIARLSELDPEMRVVMPADDGLDYAEVKDAFVDLVAPDHKRFQLIDETEPGGEEVIRLFGPDDGD